MPDFEAPPAVDGETLAQSAVRYALKRFVAEADFRYLMRHTETLRRLITAEAARRDMLPADLEEELLTAVNSRNAELRRQHGETETAERLIEGDFPVMREKLDRIECWLGEHRRDLPAAAALELEKLVR